MSESATESTNCFDNDENKHQMEKKVDCQIVKRIEPDYQLPDNFPRQLERTPSEQTELRMDNTDQRIKNLILSKFSKEIESIKCLGPHAIDRFIINWRYMEIESERIKTTLESFEKYLKLHKKHKLDSILLSKQALKLKRDNENECNENDNKDADEDEKKQNSQVDIDNCEEIEKLAALGYPWYIYGIDKAGHPICWDDGTTMETIFNGYAKKEDSSLDWDKMAGLRCHLYAHMYNLEIKLSKYYKKEIFQYCQVFDLSNFQGASLKQIEILTKHRQFWKDTSYGATNIFPETIHKVYLINVPFVIRIAAYLMSQFIHSSTLAKVKLLGSDFLDELVKDIDINMIPKKYGGKGVWEMRLLDVPKKFPFQVIDNDIVATRANDD